MSRSDHSQGWEDYFNSLPLATLGGIEIEAHKQRLASENNRIFSGVGDIEMWQKDEKNVSLSVTLFASSVINDSGCNTVGLELSGSNLSFE